MKKILPFFIICILLISGYSGFFPIKATHTEDNTVCIYQISPQISSSQIVFYQSLSHTTEDIYPSIEISTGKHANLLILTVDELVDAIQDSSYIQWKESNGYNITIITSSDNRIISQEGEDLPEKIRLFLMDFYLQQEISFLLIIGDIISIPMRYCYPNPDNHRFDIFDWQSGEVPTDYYYADLSKPDSESWDKDGDGYYGEYMQDEPGFYPDLFVGRIPVSDPTAISYTLEKIIQFEESDTSWKNNALHAGAFFYFTNEDQSGYNAMDGAVLSQYIEQDIMMNWSIHHYSEQEGLEPSVYTWDLLSENNFIDDWRTGKYSIVNWQGHGWTDKVARKVWTTDDGDEIPESHEIQWPNMITRSSNLDDDYPSIVTAVSCYVGCPERDPYVLGNLGIDLLTDASFGAAVAVVASARSPYGSEDWPNDPGGSDHIIYEFNKNIILEKMSLGEALYTAKFFCNDLYGWDHYAEYIDMFTFNLFGDPSMKLISTVDNHKPYQPDPPEGPSSGLPGTEYTYSVSTVDPDNDEIFYLFDWGDNVTSFILGPYESGEECIASHVWFEKGSYDIRVKAIDGRDAESEWSDPMHVTIPKYRSIFSFFKLNNPLFYFVNFLDHLC